MTGEATKNNYRSVINRSQPTSTAGLTDNLNNFVFRPSCLVIIEISLLLESSGLFNNDKAGI